MSWKYWPTVRKMSEKSCHRKTVIANFTFGAKPVSVCHTSEPCKNGWTDWYDVWVFSSDGSKQSYIRWGPDHPMGTGNFKGEGAPIVKCRNIMLWAMKKMAELIKMPFGMLSQMVPSNCILDGCTGPLWQGSILRGQGMPDDTLIWTVQNS